MRRASTLLVRCACLVFWLAGCAHPQHAAEPKLKSPQSPRLIVQITVDQLRGDLLTRYADRYGEGGFRRFLRDGTHYLAAHYAHAATETAVGHATLFTGALPSAHGIVGNGWYDRAAHKALFAVEDPAHPLIAPHTGESEGASPRALKTTTLGDEMRIKSAGRALVFAVSLKDRGAILPAGHAGKAFWYSDKSGAFVTSDYYYPSEPSWVTRFNERKLPAEYRGGHWRLAFAEADYVQRAHDDRASEKSYKNLGRTFPHPLPEEASADLFKTLKRTPFGDELTLAFVEALLAHEPLGRDDEPDLLSISFSATDYIAHVFGPESLEVEDQLLRLDRSLSHLFALLLSIVPEEQLVVVLSADHGSCEAPEYLTELGIPAGRHDADALVAQLNAGLAQRYGEGAQFVEAFVNPALWLDESKIAARGLVVSEVERTLAELVRAQPGFAFAVEKSALASNQEPHSPLLARVQNGFDLERTGNVVVVPASGWLLSEDGAQLSAMHGTPWAYDTHVPIAFFGASIAAQRVARPVDPRDIAMTLSTLLGLHPPSGASGHVLPEVLGTR